jgi:hypothetical protein
VTDIPAIHDLVTDVHARLSATAAQNLPAAPGKKDLEAVDESVREDVSAAIEERRAELGEAKAVAESMAKQAESLEGQMTEDIERLLKLAAPPE